MTVLRETEERYTDHIHENDTRFINAYNNNMINIYIHIYILSYLHTEYTREEEKTKINEYVQLDYKVRSGQGMYAIMIWSSTYVGMITVRRAEQP